MSLVLGIMAIPDNWSNPSPVYRNGKYVTNGMVWVGLQQATEGDIEALKEATGGIADVDEASLVGRYHPDWSSNASLEKPRNARMGGLGSETYQLQKVGEGVRFSDEPMWLRRGGEMVYDSPIDGAYHVAKVGVTYTENRDGPEPGSEADVYLGDGEFYFDHKNGWWDVK